MKAILFDLGGVVHTRANAPFRRDIAMHYDWDLEGVRSAWSKTRGAYLIGQLTEDEFWNKFLDYLETDEPYEILIKDLKEKYRFFISEHDEFFKALDEIKEPYKDSDKGPKFYVAANKGKDVAEYIIKELELKDHFDDYVFSYEAKAIKPDKKYFDFLIKKLKIKPKESIFVDDLKENTDAASKLGFKTIQYTDASSFKKKVLELLK